MKIFIKRFSIFFLAIMISTNLIINTQREAKAIVPIVIAPAVASGSVAIAYALLYGSDIAFDWSGKAYVMAEELVRDLGENAFNTVTGALVVTDAVYNAVKNIIDKYRATPIFNTTFRKSTAIKGTINTTAKCIEGGTKVKFGQIPSEYIGQSITFQIKITNLTINQLVVNSTVTKTLNSTQRNINLWLPPNANGRLELNLDYGNDYIILGNSFTSTVGSEYKLEMSSSVPFDIYNDNSVSLDYSNDLGNASVDNVKEKFPVGASISANPSATWSNPLDMGISAPIADDYITVEQPTTEVPTTEVGWLQSIWDLIKSIPQTIWDLIKGALQGITDLLTGILDFIKSIPQKIADIFNPPVDIAVPDITDKFNLPHFKQTEEILENMNTSRDVPPKITFDMSKLFGAATSRFTNSNPFESKEYTLIDFEMLQSYTFGGLPLIDYFRGLVGMGFIINTFLYITRRLSPKDIIGG